MKLFIIHRFKDQKGAKKKLNEISKQYSLKFKLTLLDSSGDIHWKQKAENAIYQSEAVIIFNPELCMESDNSKWEIEKAKEISKELIELNKGSDNNSAITRLISIYHLNDEFDNCFVPQGKDVLELYKVMVESSEQLIQRRQKTNAFFITVIGSLLAIAGLLANSGAINDKSIVVLYAFFAVGILICISWRNLIDNYGKLNKAKFDVILQLEKNFGAKIYSAEWIALGKGLRPRKYRSFTSTEKNVPLYFGLLLVLLALSLTIWLCINI